MRQRLLGSALAALVLAAFCLELHFRWGGSYITNVVDDLAELAAATAATVAGFWRARRCHGRARWSWRFVAAGTGAWACGQAIWTYYELIANRDTPFPSWADAGFLAFPILALIGLLIRPSAALAGIGRMRVLLDAILVAGSLFVLTWVTAFGQVLAAGADSRFALVVSLAYPIGDLLLLTITLVVVTHAKSTSRVGLILLAVGFAGLSVADSGFAYLTAAGSFGTGNIIDAGWVAGFSICAYAALKDRPVEESTVRAPISRSALLLPYVPAMMALTIAAYRLRGNHSDDVSLITAIVIVWALMARQLLVLRENRNLVQVITRQAFYDDLTGLANRSLFANRLEHALELHRRDLREVAILFCDLDDFKLVNDSLGHGVGDGLLVRVAERLLGTLRPGDTLARLGGD